MSNFEELERMTHLLPAIQHLVKDKKDGFIEYKTETKGHVVVGKNIYNDGRMAIQEVKSTGKGMFPAHQHTVHEWLIVLEGSFSYKDGRRKLQVLENGYAYFEPGHKHAIMFNGRCTFIAMTVPAEESYPDGTD